MPISPHTPSRSPLRLGTRRSPLAMAQAEEVRARLCAAHGWDLSAIALVPVTASGDKIQDRPLADMGGKALWTKELDHWLLSSEIDLAVHSAKDVETIRPTTLTIAAVLPREDVRDCLIGAISIADLPPAARVGTSAPRRAAQLLHLRPDCVIIPFRGNVATRLKRLDDGEAEATLLACAGLNRLNHSDIGTPLAAETWFPAPGQGAIAVECRTSDPATIALLTSIDHAPSRASLMAERAFLAALGGTCHSAIAVHTTHHGTELHMHAALFSPDGTARIAGDIRFPATDLTAPIALASQLLAQSPLSITAHFAKS